MPTPFFSGAPALVPAPCPPNAATPPPPTHLPPILPTPCTRARCALPLCTPPVTVIAQCSHCTLLSLHLAITSSGLPANFPTLQVSDFPTSRKADKSKSQQIGKLASVPPPGSTARPSSHHQPPRTGEPPAYRSSSSHPAGKPHPPARSPYPPGRPNKGVTPSYPVENVQCNRQRQMPGTDRTCPPSNQWGRALSSERTRTLRALST